MLTLIQLLLDELLEFLTTQAATQDLALLVDDDGVGDGVDVKLLSSGIVPVFQVAHLWPAQKSMTVTLCLLTSVMMLSSSPSGVACAKLGIVAPSAVFAD